MKKLTNEEFISKSINAHGLRYDYSKSKYKSSKDKIEIICNSHGSFMQKPGHHIDGHGCKKCADKEKGLNSRLTFDEFVTKSESVHGNIYNYHPQENFKSTGKVKINCNKHGYFYQIASTHMSGAGCNLCGNERNSERSKITKDEFLYRSKLIHGDRYIYSKEIEVNRSIDLVTIRCRSHGNFNQPARHHYEGKGCPKCGYISAIRKKKKEYGFHGHSRSKYISIAGMNHNGMSNLYLIKAGGNGERFWKIGISMNGVSHRFASNFPYKVLEKVEIPMKAGDAWDMEKILHKSLSRVSLTPSIKFNGYTECFSEITSEAVEILSGMCDVSNFKSCA